MPTINDATVVASAYDTSGNGGRKLARASNGYIFTIAKNGANILVYRSTDNMATTPSLFYTVTGATSIQDMSLVVVGNYLYILYSRDNNTVTIRWVDINNASTTNFNNVDTSQTTLGNVSLTYSPTDNKLKSVWASKNATLPNSFNIRYAEGTISATDGSVTWGSVTQITTINSAGSDITTPCVIVKADGNPSIFLMSTLSTDPGLHVTHFDGSVWTSLNSGRGIVIYSGGASTYTQSSPSAIFVPQSINGLTNGRIWVAWHGTDSTDTTKNNIRTSYSDDGGVTWSAMEKRTSGNSIGQMYPSITASKNNEIFILWSGDASSNYLRKIKFSSGSWGSAQTVLATGTVYSNPSTLFDLSINFTEPLYIHKGSDNASIRFSGTWTITTISVTPGAIGTKSDKSNLLSYAITTDGTMSTITEKVNGVTVGTKSATSGQSLIAGLTQAQWDAIKFGKYKDATGGLNTLTVEMGSEVWTYTFDKRLATNEDIAQAVKATQDTQTTYLPSVKSKLATAITAKGGTASGSDSWDTLVSAVANSSNKKWANGNFSWSTTTAPSTYNGAITGLAFKPKLVIIYPYGVNQNNTNGRSASATQGLIGSENTVHVAAGGLGGQETVYNLVMTSNGCTFSILGSPGYNLNGTGTWIAIGD